MLLTLITWLPLAVKLLLTAAIVVAGSITTERAGPFIGALVVTLPVTTWPAYLFLALDHDTAFVAESAVAGLVMIAVNAVLMLVYAALAQRRNLAPSLAAAVAVWALLGVAAKAIAWPPVSAAFLNLVVFSACLRFVQRYSHATMPPTRRQWHDIPLRVLLVCTMMGTILLFSNWAGPVLTGFVAVFPISSVSALVILHPRIGGPATAAMVSHGIRGQAGIGMGLFALHLTVVPLGPIVALAVALTIPVAWNLTTWATRTRLTPAQF